MRNKPSQQSLLGSTHAARALGISEQTLRRRADSGVLPHIRDAAGRRLFSNETIEAAKRRTSSR
jgi:excisionase family DNA binding protein